MRRKRLRDRVITVLDNSRLDLFHYPTQNEQLGKAFYAAAIYKGRLSEIRAMRFRGSILAQRKYNGRPCIAPDIQSILRCVSSYDARFWLRTS